MITSRRDVVGTYFGNFCCIYKEKVKEFLHSRGEVKNYRMGCNFKDMKF
jgi:hypothetical protein